MLISGKSELFYQILVPSIVRRIILKSGVVLAPRWRPRWRRESKMVFERALGSKDRK